MSADSIQFLEIEHKFVVDSTFNLDSFVAGGARPRSAC